MTSGGHVIALSDPDIYWRCFWANDLLGLDSIYLSHVLCVIFDKTPSILFKAELQFTQTQLHNTHSRKKLYR